MAFVRAPRSSTYALSYFQRSCPFDLSHNSNDEITFSVRLDGDTRLCHIWLCPNGSLRSHYCRNVVNKIQQNTHRPRKSEVSCATRFNSRASAAERNMLTESKGFYDPATENMIEPSLTGISYSFTLDGHYEEAYYRAIANRMSLRLLVTHNPGAHGARLTSIQ